MLKNKAQVNLRANDGNLPIHIATEFGHKAIVRMLLKYKSEVNAKTNGGWYKNINLNKFFYKFNTLKKLLYYIRTPLFMASQEGYLGGFYILYFYLLFIYISEIVEMLLRNNANVNIRENEGWSPLYIACDKGHVDVVDLLLKHNAKVNLKAKDDSTALHVACNNGHTKIVELLLKKKADVHMTTDDGSSALDIGKIYLVLLFVNTFK